jgi:hypothetical protein
MLCRKTVDLFTLLSHTEETGAARIGMTQELLSLVTGLAHYLKILIRIALTGVLRLDREHLRSDAIPSLLDKLHLLAVQGGNPASKRVIKGAGDTEPIRHIAPGEPGAVNYSTHGVTYGFRGLAPEYAGHSPFWELRNENANGVGNEPAPSIPSDKCVKCAQTIEEGCVRLGTYQRWHSQCVMCAHCGKTAALPLPLPKEKQAALSGEDGDQGEQPKPSTVRRAPADVDSFVYDEDTMQETLSFGKVPSMIFCTEHSRLHCRHGFQPVPRLEQYSFLLSVALRRLYLLLKKRGVIQI